MTEHASAQTKPVLRFIAVALWLAWAAGVIVTALGFTAPWFPIFDLINDARIAIAAATLLLLAGALAIRDWQLLRPTAALALLQFGLALLPLARAAGTDAGQAPALRLITFNISLYNDRFDDIAAFLVNSGADIVILQEVNCAATETLIPKLRTTLPHVLVSADTCRGMALLSKRPWTTIGQIALGARRPLLMWAQFDWDGNAFDLTAAHLARPFAPTEQAREVTRLLAHLGTRAPTQILAGDLNLTPFAWAFAQINNAGLRQHATYLTSWPSRLPFVLIDNVLSTDDVVSTRIRTGPALGSDHLPVIADIAFVK